MFLYLALHARVHPSLYVVGYTRVRIRITNYYYICWLHYTVGSTRACNVYLHTDYASMWSGTPEHVSLIVIIIFVDVNTRSGPPEPALSTYECITMRLCILSNVSTAMLA